jgi:hypothetical protein
MLLHGLTNHTKPTPTGMSRTTQDLRRFSKTLHSLWNWIQASTNQPSCDREVEFQMT